ncbi:PIG-L family deacetylase [Sphingobacterium corticis]|uniref:PIG-L family deacetylase n=1 Tax=Sphingobacterium corticis TaxID=1812823 RepID=A0ABW5NK02_9SPHI
MQRVLVFIFLSLLSFSAISQTSYSKNSSKIKAGLEKLQVLGSVLYFAAHPDDENTRLIAWLANEKKYETAYLSLTRGDGGQNLIGTELGIELGLIRTQELLAARRIDGGKQFFSSAYDFGFSKTFDETFAFWNKEETLREAVWLIRQLRPDVIVTRFPPDPRGGHGHHQASAILAHEAFIAAADPNKFPEQLERTTIWQAKRLIWNTANFGGQNNTSDDQLKIETGHYNPLLGASYGEISAESRSQHKSQGFGSAATRGASVEYFEHVAGDEAQETLFDGIKTDWSRIASGAKIAKQIEALNKSFDAQHPENAIPKLVALHKHIQQIDDAHWKAIKSREIEDLILACSGFHWENVTQQPTAAVNESTTVNQEFIVRNPNVQATVQSINGESVNISLPFNQTIRQQYDFATQQITQPYWLRKPYTLGKFDVEESDFNAPESRDFPSTKVIVNIDGLQIPLQQPITYRYVDPVRGEVHNQLQILPSITASTSQTSVLLRPELDEEKLEVTFTNHSKSNSATVVANAPTGLDISPKTVELRFGDTKSITQTFMVKSTGNAGNSKANEITFTTENDTVRTYRSIAYDHIPAQAWFPKLSIKALNLDIHVPIKRVAYLPGAGDRVPESLKAIGVAVDLITAQQIANLSTEQYDAIVIGVRAFNVQRNLTDYTPALLRFAENGGTVLVQYNVNSGINGATIGPKPFQVTRARVTEEDAKVSFLLPNDPALQNPNRIEQVDFDGWIQERGLYFAEQTDVVYRKPLSMHDKNEPAHDGSLLIAKHGKGKFVYTSLAFFRQLPAGVPGAYRLFVNLLAREEQ